MKYKQTADKIAVCFLPKGLISLLLLNADTLKIIAAFTMLIDHIGYIFFPEISIFRIIGRLSFPIFAFMISEGCTYTRNKRLYFIRILLLAIVCQIPYFLIEKELHLSILFTFSLSVIAIYSFLLFKNCEKPAKRILLFSLFVFTVAVIYTLNKLVNFDYGFWGCMAPVFAVLFQKRSFSTASFFAGLIILSVSLGGVQPFCILAMPLLFLYNGKKGKRNMKYFFYIFYPLHLVILYGIYIAFF